jgi:hypothetical protein
LIAALVAACVVPIAATGFIFRDQVMKVLGLNPEIERRTTESRKVVADKKQEIEKVERSKEKPSPVVHAKPKAPAAEAPRRPVAASEAPEAKNPPDKREPDSAAKRAVAVAKTPTPDEPISTTELPLFLPLEEPVSGLAPSNGQKDTDVGAVIRDIKRMELLGDQNHRLKTSIKDGEEPLLLITQELPQDRTSLTDRRSEDLATFWISRAGKLQFQWRVNGPEDRKTERQHLRDCIVKIESKDKAAYVILRNPPTEPQSSLPFRGQIRAEKDKNSTTYIYKWDSKGEYHDRLPYLTLEDCVLTRSGKPAEKLLRNTGSSWSMKHDGEVLLSVDLGRVEIAKGKESLRIVECHTDAAGRPGVGRPDAVASETAFKANPDVSSVLVVRISDPNPGTLEKRIAERDEANRKAREELKETADRGAAQKQKEIDRRQAEIERLRRLLDIHRADLDAKICWACGGIKLEVARLQSKKPVTESGQPGT